MEADRLWRVVVASCGLVAGLVLIATSPAEAQLAEALDPSALYRQISPAVPRIETPHGHGSGTLVDPTHVITDLHVVTSLRAVTVRFPDETETVEGRVVLRDPMTDLAVVEIPEIDVAPVVLATAEMSSPGAQVFQIGYPGPAGSDAPPAMSSGVISRVHEWDTARITSYETDASAIGGMSGGPLVSGDGTVLGIIQTQISGGAFVMSASVVDLMRRAGQIERGANVDGISKRYPVGQLGTQFAFLLSERPYQQAFALFAMADQSVTISITASGADSEAQVVAQAPGGEQLDYSFAWEGRSGPAMVFPVHAGEQYWIIVEGFGPPPVSVVLESSAPLVMVSDPDEGVLTSTRTAGALDFVDDEDCFAVGIRAGDSVEVIVESMAFDAEAELFDPSGELVAYGADSGGGLHGTNAKVTFTAETAGVHRLCLWPYSYGHTGGYFVLLSRSSQPVVATEDGADPVAPEAEDPDDGVLPDSSETSEGFDSPWDRIGARRSRSSSAEAPGVQPSLTDRSR